MRLHRLAATAVVTAAAAWTLAGCSGIGTGTPGAGGSASPSAAARNATDELVAAAGKLRAGTYRFRVTVTDVTLQGAADPVTKGVQLTSRVAAGGTQLNLELLAVGPDFYARIDGLAMLGIDRDTWLHIDGTKIKSLALIGIADPSDPTGAGSFGKQIVTATRSGDRFRGTLDLTRASVAGVPVSAVASLGEKAKSVPFEATVDPAGRLATVSFTLPAQNNAPATPVSVTYSDFGGSTGISKPTTNVVEAPPAVYSILGAAG